MKLGWTGADYWRITMKEKKKQQPKTGKSNIKFINYCLKFKYMNKILMIYKLPTDGSNIKFKRYSLFRDEIHLTAWVSPFGGKSL